MRFGLLVAFIVAQAVKISAQDTSCFDHVGNSCNTSGDRLCCTTNGFVFCNEDSVFVYIDCPNGESCHTDFSTGEHLCLLQK